MGEVLRVFRTLKFFTELQLCCSEQQGQGRARQVKAGQGRSVRESVSFMHLRRLMLDCVLGFLAMKKLCNMRCGQQYVLYGCNAA